MQYWRMRQREAHAIECVNEASSRQTALGLGETGDLECHRGRACLVIALRGSELGGEVGGHS